MTTWRVDRGRGQASAHALEILADIQSGFRELGLPDLKVRSIRIGAEIGDLHDFEVEVELAPGAVMAVRYQSVDEEGRDPQNLDNEAGAVAALVMYRAKDYFDLGVGFLIDTLHDVRVRTRKTVASWSLGTLGQLVDVRFATTEYLWPGENLNIEVRLRSLDDRLRPAIISFNLEHPDQLDKEVASWRPQMEQDLATLLELSREGADFSVDELVLNAIGPFADAAEALRGHVSGRPVFVSEALSVWISRGHVMCHGRDQDDARVHWSCNRVMIDSVKVSETLLTALVGRPVTQLVRHRVLSDQMIIRSVTNVCDHGGQGVCAEFDQPRWLFCSASGRLWRPDRDRQT